METVPVAIGVEPLATSAEYAEDVVARLVTTIECVPLGVPAVALAVRMLELEEVADTSVNCPAGSVSANAAVCSVCTSAVKLASAVCWFDRFVCCPCKTAN